MQAILLLQQELQNQGKHSFKPIINENLLIPFTHYMLYFEKFSLIKNATITINHNKSKKVRTVLSFLDTVHTIKLPSKIFRDIGPEQF